MPDINCCFPITVRLMGDLSDQDLEDLGIVLERTLVGRIAFAEQTLATNDSTLAYDGERSLVREDYDPSREDATTYRVPTYQAKGQPTRVPLQGGASALARRPWFIRRASNFHARVGEYLDYVEGLRPDRSLPEKVLYTDLFGDLRWVSVWLVQVNRPMRATELEPILYRRAAELSRIQSNQLLAYGHGFTEGARQQLIDIDEDGVVTRDIPDMTRNTTYIKLEGTDHQLRPGSWVLTTTMVLPRIELADVATLHPEIRVLMRLRDLTFLVPEVVFERETGVAWATYIDEFGDVTVTMRIQPITVKRRIHFLALQYLVAQLGLERIKSELTDPDKVYFEALAILNNATLGQLPAVLRSQLGALTNDVSLGVDRGQAADHWQPNWRGAYFLAVTTISRDDLGAALYRPQARTLTPLLLAQLAGDPTESRWGFELLDFLKGTFGSEPPDTRPPGGTPFEYVLEELEKRGQFDTLFDKAEQAHIGLVFTAVIRLALATRYAAHPRVRRSRDMLATRVLEGRKNIYRVAERELWLDRDPDYTLRVGGVLGEVSPVYIKERKEQRLKSARVADFRAALDTERKALIGRILSGEETRQYTQEEFTKETVAAAAKRIALSKDDFETVTIQRSLRLLDLEARTEKALPRFYVTFEFVERAVGEPWQSASQQITEGDSDFEARLIYLALGKAGEFYEAAGLAITVVGVILIAWEAGIVAWLIEIAGGAVAVGVSIGVSELLYIIRVVFGDAKLSLGGFLEAALEGYLMALGFRGGGLLGRVAARSIGTQSLRSIVGGWVAERLVTGTVGGAASAALIRFSHDVVNVATGRGGWSSIGDYVRDMTWGALLGTVFEFGVGALAPLLRASGENAFATLSQVVEKVKTEGFTAVRWTTLTADALGNMRAKLTEIMGDVAANGFARAMGERLAQVTEQLGAEYRLAVFRRVLELSPEALSRSSVGGLERFLNASRAELTNEAALSILNSLKPDGLRAFLESLNRLDSHVIGALGRSRQLEALARAPQTLDLIGSDPVLSDMVARTASLPAEAAAARIRALAAVAGRMPAVPESVTRGSFFAEGGTSKVYEVQGQPDLLVKQGGGRLPIEARSLVELELMGIDTVYAGTREGSGIVLRRIDGVGSKEIIGRLKQRLRTPQNIEVVTQRTIDDLERIYKVLQENRANVGDFQFIVRRSDGAVFVNDPVSVTRGGGPKGDIRNIIESFKAILRRKQAGGPL